MYSWRWRWLRYVDGVAVLALLLDASSNALSPLDTDQAFGWFLRQRHLFFPHQAQALLSISHKTEEELPIEIHCSFLNISSFALQPGLSNNFWNDILKIDLLILDGHLDYTILKRVFEIPSSARFRISAHTSFVDQRSHRRPLDAMTTFTRERHCGPNSFFVVFFFICVVVVVFWWVKSMNHALVNGFVLRTCPTVRRDERGRKGGG